MVNSHSKSNKSDGMTYEADEDGDLSSDDMRDGLHDENLEEIERIHADAVGTNGTSGTQGPGKVAIAPQGSGSKKQRRYMNKMTSDALKHFVNDKKCLMVAMMLLAYIASMYVYMMDKSREAGSVKILLIGAIRKFLDQRGTHLMPCKSC